MAVVSPGADITTLSLRYSITVNGTPIDNTLGVTTIHVKHEVNRISSAEFVLTGTPSPDDSSLPFTDGDTFAPGNPVTISAAFGDNAESLLFTGLIVKHGIAITQGNVVRLQVTCKHAAVQMTFGRKEQLFSEQTDSAIMEAIIGAYGISCTVDSTSTPEEFFLQKIATDWDVVLSRAEFNGMLIYMDGSTLQIAKPVLDGSPVLRVAAGESMIGFEAELNAEKQAPSVAASSWNIAALELQQSAGEEPSVNAQGNLSAQQLSATLRQSTAILSAVTPLSPDNLLTWANGHLMRMRLSAFRGTVTFIGSAAIQTGKLIQLEGVGQKFNGNAFVSAVTHHLEQGTWKTTVQFGLDNRRINERPDYSYLPANGQLPAIQGLQVGIVRQLSQDPQSLYRVLVYIPTNAEAQTGVWARFANFYATANAGVVFLPEIGDEVLLGFIENDPRYPVVLGSLYSTSKPSPNPPPDEQNFIKWLSTKSNLKLSFDDQNKIITLLTPGGNTIVLNDTDKSIDIKDASGNELKMSSTGILLSSSSDLNLSAKANISINAGAQLSLEAKADLSASGLNIAQTAQIGFSAKGTATAELSASGQTTVRGGLVMIN